MVEIRRHLHRHPELSNEERETQAYLRGVLEAEGFEVVRDAAGHGLVVDIVGEGEPSGRKVAIRADIDALPIEEASGVAFASVRPGVMHACGHDAHAAMAVGAALLLRNRRSEFGGTARIIFQPAEEAEPLGGRRVVAEGLLDDVDAAIGIHVDPYAPTRTVCVGSGPYTLACDTFDIAVLGRSAHAARPADGVDAIAVACSMVSELQKIVSREIDPFDPLVVSVTAIKAGGAYNVVADRAALRGTIRYGHQATREHAWARLRAILAGLAAAHRADVEIDIHEGEPPVVNDAGMAGLVIESVTRQFGPDALVHAPGWTAADDFGFYSERVPSVYFRLGIRNEAEGSVHPLHHPAFRVDEAAMPMGAATLCDVAQRFLARS
ncbi:M20 metallopeptidase family protein [Aureimonas ureilytica]|uniref:M20 metallopeptidase family protein n=1 Tax=Aureimonas ureilytica TaxID=401562 RepID=UPI00037F2EBD|nr:amidohydrolase [Aureimonas ureilytica]